MTGWEQAVMGPGTTISGFVIAGYLFKRWMNGTKGRLDKLENQKVDRAWCETAHQGNSKGIDRIEGKVDKLLDLHLKA